MASTDYSSKAICEIISNGCFYYKCRVLNAIVDNIKNKIQI